MRATLSFVVSPAGSWSSAWLETPNGLSANCSFRLRGQVSSLNSRESLLLRARITKIDPGSQAARYWGSFSARAAIVEITGDIFDEHTNAVHRQRSKECQVCTEPL